MVNKNRNVITINLQGDIGEIFRDRELFIYQYDDGQELYFPDYEELGITEVQFANENSGEAIRREMTDGYVQIPYSLLSQNRPIFAYVMCITSDSTTTMIKLIIQNNCRVIAEDPIDPEDEQTFREWVQEEIDGKQDTLTAGENITIVDNVISATGGGRVNELDDLADVDVAGATDGQFLAYDAENEEWENVDGMTESKVNQQIDDKLVPYSKVYNAVAIEYSESFLTLKAKINTTFSQPPFKLTDLIILPISSAILNDQSPRYINILDVNDQSIGSFELRRRSYKMVDNSVYLIRINASNKVDIISSSVITSDNVSGLTALLNAKQNTLTAGSGITIENDVISATGGGGGVDELSELTDVAISSPINKQTLKYDSITQKWVNVADDLTGLSDVTLNSPSNNQVLVYNGLLRKWVNGTAPSGISNLSNLNDVDVTGVTNGQIIKWNATTQKWESADETTTDLTNIPHVYTAYYLSQTSQTINLVINELDGSGVIPTSGDFIIFTTLAGETFEARKPNNVAFYASDEQTQLGTTRSLRVAEQFVANNNYEMFIDASVVRTLSDNVNSVAQVNSLIDAKINALGNAEEEEF